MSDVKSEILDLPVSAEPVTDSTAPESVNPEVRRLRESAEDAIARGFAIFALKPCSKQPHPIYAPHGFKSASKNHSTALRAWDESIPANYAISPGDCDLAVVDIDHGLSTVEEFEAWRAKNHFPETLTVRTGRRVNETTGAPEVGFQMYYSGPVPSRAWKIDGVTGELKSVGGYVVGVGSVHPISGERYAFYKDIPVVPLPAFVITAANDHEKTVQAEVSAGGLIPPGERFKTLQSRAGYLRNAGLSEEGIAAGLKDYCVNRCEDGENYWSTNEEKYLKLAHDAFVKFEENPPGGVVIVHSPGDIIIADDDSDLDMPDSVLDGFLGELASTRLARFPVSLSWTSIATIAGALINRHDGTHIPPKLINTDVRTNLYTALVGPVGCGKSLVISHTTQLFGLGEDDPHLLTMKINSGEGLMDYLDTDGDSRIFSPDELAHTLRKASIDNASLDTILNSAYYQDHDKSVSKDRLIEYNARLSIIGGIPEERFGDAFGKESFGGLFDRFTYGHVPSGVQVSYRPFEGSTITPSAKPVWVNPDVWEAQDAWQKENKGASSRVFEIALRFAYIAACYSGKKILSAKDLKPALALADYQRNVRMILQPNGGETYVARMESAILAALHKKATGKNAGKWCTEKQLKDRLNFYRNRYGTELFRKAIQSLLTDKQIEKSESPAGHGTVYRIRLDMKGGK